MIIWIASYPKSGNTWVRSLLSAYLYSDDGIFNFDLLKKIQQFPSEKYFEFFTKDFNNIKKQSNYWIAAQDRINLSNEITFLKTHSALCTFENNPFTNKSNTKAVIYVVRDPRNIVTSVLNHYSFKNIEESFDFIAKDRITITGGEDIVQYLGTWQQNYKSWRDLKFAPVLVVKYEDLINDTKKTFLSILNFLKNFMDIKIYENKILKTIESCSFERLAKKEEIEGFKESVYFKKSNKKLKFFYLGKKNNWKNLLDPKIEKKIRKVFPKEMKELGYI